MKKKDGIENCLLNVNSLIKITEISKNCETSQKITNIRLLFGFNINVV